MEMDPLSAYVPYSGYLFSLDDETRDLKISTFSRGNHTVWIEGASANGTSPTYLKIDVEIYRVVNNISEELVNFAPDFGQAVEDISYSLEATSLFEVLPPVIDTNFCRIKVSSPNLGTASF